LSPYSIGSAMSMTLLGARGATEQEMRLVLKHSLSRQDIDAANGEVLAMAWAALKTEGNIDKILVQTDGAVPFSYTLHIDGPSHGMSFPVVTHLPPVMIFLPSCVASHCSMRFRSVRQATDAAASHWRVIGSARAGLRPRR
jgi:hypothetical protein